jgi:hypothetical protein
VSKRRSPLTWGAELLAVPVLSATWWCLREPAAHELSRRREAPSLAAAQVPVRPAVSAASVASLVRDVSVLDSDTLPDGLRIAPANSGQAHEPGMLPHPITDQHRRIFRENALIGQLNGAMDARDARGLRALVAEYRDQYPEDAHVLQDGSELIARCLEGTDDTLRAAARRYYDERLDSGLRRYIRRHCLEN